MIKTETIKKNTCMNCGHTWTEKEIDNCGGNTPIVKVCPVCDIGDIRKGVWKKTIVEGREVLCKWN